MRQTLIIRFGALGDLCLLAWSISRWARSEEAAGQRITLVTKAAFAPLMEKVEGIDRVIPLPEGGIGSLQRLAKQLRGEKFDSIIDAHNILRGHLLMTFMGRRANTRLEKDTAARLALLGFSKSSQSLDRSMADRFDDVFKMNARTELAEALPPLRKLRPDTELSPPVLGLAPGAQWNSKRWPEENFARLLEKFGEENNNPVRIFLGPREELWFAGSHLEKVADLLPQVEIIRGRNLVEVAGLLARCSNLVTNDSGLLHMAEAVGTPVLAFFGPTVRQFGYFPCLEKSRQMEISLDCRPCSRNGKKDCHRGDLACLRGISADQAFNTLAEMLADAESSS